MTDSPWLVRFAPRPTAALRVFCCPFAGGTAAYYAEWARSLDPLLELVAVQLPGRANRLREAPCESMSAIIAALLHTVPQLLDKPYVIYGHSMGASIALELARELIASRQPPPLCLVVSGSSAPHLPRRRAPINHLPDEQFLARLVRYGGMPEQIINDKALCQLFLPALRADFKVVESYRSSGAALLRLPLPAFVHGGTTDDTVDVAELQAWSALLEVMQVTLHAGGHFFVKDHYQQIFSEVLALARAHPTKLQRAAFERSVR